MACKSTYKTTDFALEDAQNDVFDMAEETVNHLLFGTDSRHLSNDLLQNNLDAFEWVTRNKLYPNFWGRNIAGENALTRGEIAFLHGKGCKIAAIYPSSEEKKTEEQGKLLAKKAALCAAELGVPENAAIFLELGEKENATTDFLRGFAKALLFEGFTPGFRANTDAKFGFDREFSRGMQTDKALFGKCLIWAVAPSLAEYDRVTTTHLIHPDNWAPFAPSGITRNQVAVWQYGKNCHPIHNDAGKETTFNVDLVRNVRVIVDKMF